MKTARIEPSKEVDAEYIGARLRQADRDEIKASHMIEPVEALKLGLKKSDFCLTAFADNEPVLMWGIKREGYIPNVGVPWMLATERLEDPKVARRFLRMCRNALMEFFEDYDILMNYVDTRNEVSIRWLKYMGFHVDENPMECGVLKKPFHKFIMTRGILCAARS